MVAGRNYIPSRYLGERFSLLEERTSCARKRKDISDPGEFTSVQSIRNYPGAFAALERDQTRTIGRNILLDRCHVISIRWIFALILAESGLFSFAKGDPELSRFSRLLRRPRCTLKEKSIYLAVVSSRAVKRTSNLCPRFRERKCHRDFAPQQLPKIHIYVYIYIRWSLLWKF